ncbi:hypothetical protein EJ110_NYTH06135 [Nymphaea thermarum]|nr:hypothetical protein EJ110_NYTH06135 [Nymphaea thermarum]
MEALSHIVKGKRSKRQRPSRALAMASRFDRAPGGDDIDRQLQLQCRRHGHGALPDASGPERRGSAEFATEAGGDGDGCSSDSRCDGGHQGIHKKPKAREEKEKASMAAVMQQQQGRRGAAEPWLG